MKMIYNGFSKKKKGGIEMTKTEAKVIARKKISELLHKETEKILQKGYEEENTDNVLIGSYMLQITERITSEW